MVEPSPERSRDADPAKRYRSPARRPPWVTAVVIGAVLLLAVVVVLHLTGNSPGGPGSHLP